MRENVKFYKQDIFKWQFWFPWGPVETLTNLAEPKSTSPKCYRATDPGPRNSESLRKCWQIRRNQQWRKSCWSTWFSSQIHGMDGDFVWLKERLYSLASPSRGSAVAPNQHVHTPWWHCPLHSKSSESPQLVNRHPPARFPLIHSDTDTAATSFCRGPSFRWGGVGRRLQTIIPQTLWEAAERSHGGAGANPLKNHPDLLKLVSQSIQLHIKHADED